MSSNVHLVNLGVRYQFPAKDETVIDFFFYLLFLILFLADFRQGFLDFIFLTIFLRNIFIHQKRNNIKQDFDFI